MGWVRDILGGVADPVGKAFESRETTKQTEALADAATEQSRITATAAAVAAGQSTWRPKWMHSLRVLLAFYFGLSFAGGVMSLAALGAVFLGWWPQEAWDRISPELLWLMSEWGSLGAKLIGLAGLSYAPAHLARSWEKVHGVAAGGAGIPAARPDDDVSSQELFGREQPPAREVRREPLQPREGSIERLDGVIVPPRRAEGVAAVGQRVTSPIGIAELRAEIERDEGRVDAVYRDSLGHKTAGIGKLLTPDMPEYAWEIGTPIPPSQVEDWFTESLSEAMADARAVVPSFDAHSPEVRRVLVNMAFNLGRERLSKFKRTLALIERREYAAAADEALNSRWAAQVGPRAIRLAARLRAAEPDLVLA